MMKIEPGDLVRIWGNKITDPSSGKLIDTISWSSDYSNMVGFWPVLFRVVIITSYPRSNDSLYIAIDLKGTGFESAKWAAQDGTYGFYYRDIYAGLKVIKKRSKEHCECCYG